jgi:nucleoside-diphosphate kinase
MNTQITLALIKPDAVQARNTGRIIAMIEDNGFEIVRLTKGKLRKEDAEHFYAIHKDRPFFSELISFITSGPIVIMALVKENAVADWRALMGPTDSKKAPKGTVRHAFGTDVCINAVHGSDSVESAAEEVGLFFSDLVQEEGDES